MKTFEAALQAAFEAGLKTGTGYASREAMPAGWAHVKYRAFRDHLAGNTWSPGKWAEEMGKFHSATIQRAFDGAPRHQQGPCENPNHPFGC